MAIEEPPFASEAPRRSMLGLVLIVLGAFLLGGVLVALGVRNGWFDRWVTTPATTTAAPLPVSVPRAPASSLDMLSAREASLSMRLGELENRVAALQPQARAASGYATRAEGMMVLSAARLALDRGLPLGWLEPQLRQRFGEAHPREVGTVIAVSRQPVVLEELRQALDEVRPRLTGGDLSQGWWFSIRRQLAGLVTLRREGTINPRAPERFDRARDLLDAGKVAAALAEVVRLPGAPAGEAWIAAARRYVVARRALDTLEQAAIAAPLPAAAGAQSLSTVDNNRVSDASGSAPSGASPSSPPPGAQP